MKKNLYRMMFAFLFLWGSLLTAQIKQNFESYAVGTAFPGAGWSITNAIVVNDPFATGNKVLQDTNPNYNHGIVIPFVLPSGKTLANYDSLTFRGYFLQGDVGYKTILVGAYASRPTSAVWKTAQDSLGMFARNANGSTAWENIKLTLNTNAPIASTLHDTIYIVLGFNGAGTGSVGGSGLATVWYVDDVTLWGPAPVVVGDTTLVTQWGALQRYGWKLIPNTTPGSAGIGDTTSAHKSPQGSWATLRGDLGGILTPTTSNAVVVKGKIQFIGGGPTSWSALRFGVFNNQHADSLQFPGTDSARWVYRQYPGTDTSRLAVSDASAGYMFAPRSGTNIPTNGSAGNGEVYLNKGNGASWVTTNNGNVLSIATLGPAPVRAQILAGTYDWAVSIKKVTDTTSQLTWYFGNAKYWFGGQLIVPAASATYNGVIFGINNGSGIDQTGLYDVELSNVSGYLGAEVTVPAKLWSDYYVTDWGAISRYGWKILRDSSTLDGNAGIGDTTSAHKPPQGGWATLRGGFVDSIVVSTDYSYVIKGTIQFIGGGATSWSALRYGLFNQRSAGTLQYALTDSARWGTIDTSNKLVANETGYGYMFTPRSGTNIPTNGTPGNADLWINNGAAWVTTNNSLVSNGGLYIPTPARAQMLAGTYNWVIAVRKVATGNEIRFYMGNTKYWYGGTYVDTALAGKGVTSAFNGVVFGIDNGNGIDQTGLYDAELAAVQVTRSTSPYVVPDPIWSDYYITDWAFYGNKTGGWKFTAGALDGDATIGGGDTVANTGWAALRGAFVSPLSVQVGKAVKVSGSLEFVNDGFAADNSLRVGFFNTTSAGSIAGDSANRAWSGDDIAQSGYLFIPQSGKGDAVDWNNSGVAGTFGTVANGTWFIPGAAGNLNSYSLGSPLQSPAGAVAGKGTYNYSVLISNQGNNTSYVKFSLANADNSYSYVAEKSYNKQAGLPLTFNSLAFALNTGNSTTTVNATNTLISYIGTPVSVIGGGKNGNVPAVYALSQNYPNPFNPTTTIQYSLPKDSHVKLIVYDVLGRAVANLVDGMQTANSYKVTFNASNLSSGIYFYRIDAKSQDGSKNFTSVKKLVLLK